MKKLSLRKEDDDTGHKTLYKRVSSENHLDSRRKISDIIKNDFHACFTNPIVVMVLVGIILLPSLYALVNISACWDPYENTNNMEFAVANEDLGAEYNGEKIEVGAKLIDSLKESGKFRWVFVSSDDLRRGVHNGTYYAGMIIPQNFSQSVVSITTSQPHSAELEYVVNQKTNPVAAKLADAAAKEVYNKINAQIVSFIDVTALNKLALLQEGLASGADKMEDGADKLSAGADQVASGADRLSSGANELSSGADTLAGGANELSNGAKLVSTGATEIAQGSSELSSGADKLSSGASEVADGTHQMATKVDEIADVIHKIIKILENGGSSSKLGDDIDKLSNQASFISQSLNQLDNQSHNVSNDAANLSNQVNKLSYNASNVAYDADVVASNTHEIANDFNNVSNDLSTLSQEIKTEKNQSKILELLEKIDSETTNVSHKFERLDYGAHQVANGSNQLSSGANRLSNASYQLADGSNQLSSGADQLASGANKLSSGVHVLSNGTIELASGAELLGYSSASALRNASNEIGSAADQFSAISEINQEDAGDYFYSPVILKRHEEFPTSSYGSQVSPFYLILSMWVGAIVTCVMLKTGSSIGSRYKPHEIYMGKLVMFNIMAILQTTVTLIGALLLGVDVSNPLMFIFSCYFASMVFMTLMYSLISLFGLAGKGIAILLLVFQISGSGGIYPIEIMNPLFGVLYPYLPMTHAINIVRESQLGLIWMNYWPSFVYLWFIGMIVVIISILLKQKWDKRTQIIEEKLEESNLFN